MAKRFLQALAAIPLFIIRLAPAQPTEVIVHNFTSNPNGSGPSGLIRDSAGNLYGSTAGGGTANAGVIFVINTAGIERVLYNFTGGVDGANPASGVIADAAGNLYGTTYLGGSAGLGVVYKLDSSRHLTVLHSFTGGADGASPMAGVIRDPAGNLYGTTYTGGAAGAGVVYKIDPLGSETVMYTFTGGADGCFPQAGVIRDASGNLYGTTILGGAFGLGVVFKLTSAGAESVLHDFAGGADGTKPCAALIRDAQGNLYSTTFGGGTGGVGTVFKLDPTGRETILYNFVTGGGGVYPYSPVTRDAAGNLYGTASGYLPDWGMVYKLDAQGTETTLYKFTGSGTSCPTGCFPYSGVVLDSSGNLYGTTLQGGPMQGSALAGNGVAYKIDASGQETVIYTFTAGTDGTRPWAGMIRDSAGNLYGTTLDGGVNGVVYMIDPAGAETVLHNFTGATDGANPYSSVIRDAAGNLYGTASAGGTKYGGIVYKLKNPAAN